jgi:hypothetical protein
MVMESKVERGYDEEGWWLRGDETRGLMAGGIKAHII